MQNLVDAMQIGRQSLYNTFGDKRTLFLRTLELYDEDVQRNTLEELNREDSGIAEVNDFLHKVSRSLYSQEIRRGCYLMNSILELSSSDERVHEMALEYRGSLIKSIEGAIERSKTKGEIHPDLDSHSSALQLTNTSMGLSLTWKSGATKEEMLAIVEGALTQTTPSGAPPVKQLT